MLLGSLGRRGRTLGCRGARPARGSSLAPAPLAPLTKRIVARQGDPASSAARQATPALAASLAAARRRCRSAAAAAAAATRPPTLPLLVPSLRRAVIAKDGPPKVPFASLYEMFQASVAKFPDNNCLGHREGDGYAWLTYKQTEEQVGCWAGDAGAG